MDDFSGGVRQRARRAVRAELSRLAMNLFADRGFDETTVDDIAKAAGLSKRSFFRYFPSKEDVVFGGIDLLGQQVIDELRQRPAGEEAWDSLREVLRGWATQIYQLGESAPQFQLIESTPALSARFHHTREQLREDIAAVLCERFEGELSAFEADLLSGAAGAALQAAAKQWARDGGGLDHDELVDLAFVMLRPKLSGRN